MDDLYLQWKKEEQTPFVGWDFSYLRERWFDEKSPWNYKQIARELLDKSTSVLDMGTGGGEVLSSLTPFPEHTVATEGYKPNVSVARKRLKPLGVKVFEVDESGKLPFKDVEFDLVINKHSAYDEVDVYRILKLGGIFLTQQVSGDNLKDLVSEFGEASGNTRYTKTKNLINWSLEVAVENLKKAGFIITQTEEWTGKLNFNDLGALVYYLKAIPWVVSGFSVDTHKQYLEKLQARLEKDKILSFTQTRFLIQAQKR